MEYDETVYKLRERYLHIHPLIFHRSVERAGTAVELFDALDSFTDKYPICWDNITRCWLPIDDLTMREKTR
jgi:hypothetical protein